VHTSTVTVAVFAATSATRPALLDADVQVFVSKSTGPGGQHRNKTLSCVTLCHTPTGITAKADSKSQHDNRRVAWQMLEARVEAHYQSAAKRTADSARKQMVGSGMRADKIRTYREQDNVATDHRSSRKCRLSDLLKGRLEMLH
jgi:peptide chain release factor 1